MAIRYDEVFNQTSQFITLLDPKGIILDANATSLDFGGLERDDVLGRKLWETDWFDLSERTRRRVRQDVERAAIGESVHHELTLRGAHNIRTIDFVVRPLNPDGGDVSLLIAEGHDLIPVTHEWVEGPKSLTAPSESDLLVSYPRRPDESMSQALLQAFLALDIDIFQQEGTLQDWIEIDSLDGFAWHEDSPKIITTLIWGFPVEMTGNEVRIFSDSASVEDPGSGR